MMKLDPKRLFNVKPQEFFRYPACEWCLWGPCKEIQFDGPVREYGCTFKIVHNSEYKSSFLCPFAADDFEEVQWFLERLAIHEIHSEISWLMMEFEPRERLHFASFTRYLWNWADYGSKIEYLKALWREEVFVFIRNPQVPQDDKVKEWLNAWHIALDTWEPRKDKEETPLAAVEAAAPAGPSAELNEARWFHLLDSPAKERPKAVRDGDKIKLSVKTINIPDGGLVVFKLFNVGGKSARTLESIEARAKENVAECEWETKKDAKQEDWEIEFEAQYQEIVSGRVKIEWEKILLVSWCLDCHSHINNGHAAPLPLSRDKVPLPFVNRYLSQGAIDTMGNLFLGKFGDVQKEPTGSLGARLIGESGEAIKSPKFKFMGEAAKRRRLVATMPMNMDYAHYRGNEGRMIYENKDGKTVYWDEKDKKYRAISDDDFYQWVRYTTQIAQTAKCFYQSAGNLLPFYHYDPRANLIDWMEPFRKNLVQTAPVSSFPENMPAAGIKMYTALGYRPHDPNINFPWDLYYGFIARNNIPLLCHGSRGGMTTHDMTRYYEHAYPDSTNAPLNYKISWFLQEFVSPYAWEKVLQKFPGLYLCLAHFGGDTFWGHTGNAPRGAPDIFWQNLDDRDPENWIAGFLHLMKTYPNFYVDLAYVVATPMRADLFKKALMYDPVVKERILFGTDWWMYTLEKGCGGNSYMKYMEVFVDLVLSLKDKAFLERTGVKCPEELLAYFMTLNPLRFLQLKRVVPMMSKAFHQDKIVQQRQKKYEPDEWIQSIPDKIEDFYQ